MLNTIGNNFFINNPNKVLGEFSISPYMNKIIVKGSKSEVELYFNELLSNKSELEKANEVTIPKSENKTIPIETRLKLMKKMLEKNPNDNKLKIRIKLMERAAQKK